MDKTQPEMRKLALKCLAVLAAAAALLWAAWITHNVTQTKPQRIVSVRLAETIGTFIDEAARADADPASVQAASLAYLKAAEQAVAEMGADGRVILVSEAVLAGDAEDATEELETRIARRLQQELRP